jgi:hypothetical protein
MIPIDIARMVIRLMTITAKYEHGNTHCPVCGTISPTYCTSAKLCGYQTRYHECPGCGATFKSVGESREVLGKIPDTATTEQPAPHNRGKKGRRK